MADEIKKLARSGFGYNSIILHKLGYKLKEQAELTIEQKKFLIESYKFFHETNEKEREKEGYGSSKKPVRKNIDSVKRMVKENGRRSSHNN